MWVRVDDCDDQKQLVFGMLDNEPLNVYCGKGKLGSARFDHRWRPALTLAYGFRTIYFADETAKWEQAASYYIDAHPVTVGSKQSTQRVATVSGHMRWRERQRK
jgi:hypothetical protein